MKIAVSSTGKTVNDLLDARFGRCRYFVIYDTEDDSESSVENKGQYEGGGAGISAAQQLLDKQIDVLITGNLGPNAFNIFDRANVEVYQTNSIPIKTAIDLYKKGRLSELTQSGPAHHGMGAGIGAGTRRRGGN